MTLSTDDLIAALRLRYDYYSARSVFELARDRAGLAEKAAYDLAEAKALRAALFAVGDRLDNVVARLDHLLEEAPSVTAAPAPKHAASPKQEPKQAAAAAPEPTAAAATKTATRTAIETTIVLTGIEVAEGEQIFVCGGSAALGDWDPERARQMARKGDQWLATIEVPSELEVSFKFLRRTTDGSVIWETGDDRSLIAKPRLDLTWR